MAKVKTNQVVHLEDFFKSDLFKKHDNFPLLRGSVEVETEWEWDQVDETDLYAGWSLVNVEVVDFYNHPNAEKYENLPTVEFGWEFGQIADGFLPRMVWRDVKKAFAFEIETNYGGVLDLPDALTHSERCSYNKSMLS